MKKNIITGILLLLATSCTNTIAEDVLTTTEEETNVTLTSEQARAKYKDYDKGLQCGKYLVYLSTYCEDLTIPEEIRMELAKNPNDIEAVIKAMQNLETQVVFGDTLAECEEYYDGWVNFCTLNDITIYYDI